MPDFTVRIKNLPPQTEYDSLNQLAAMLTVHLTRVIEEEPAVLEARAAEEVKPSEIVNIHFAQKDFSNYKKLIAVEKLASEGQKLRNRLRNARSQATKAQLEKKIDRTKEQILDLVEDYRKHMDETNGGEIKNAFVTFRSMEGAARAIQAYNWSRAKRCWAGICCRACSARDSLKRKVFQGRFLKVERAVEPSLILWENLRFSRSQRCCRIFFSSMIAFLLLIAATAVILYVKIVQTEMSESQVDCSEAAVLTIQKVQNKINKAELAGKGGLVDELYCFCQVMLTDAIMARKNPLDSLSVHFPDGEQHCLGWVSDYSINQTMQFVVPMAIIFVNWFSKTFLRLLTKQEGY